MKTRRHAKILELIKAQDIDTQEELLRNLRACGFDVTQATVSRDIKELRLVKSLSSSGKYKYSTGRDNARDISSKFYSLFGDSVIHVEAAGNMIVVKCMTGMAQAVCASIHAVKARVVCADVLNGGLHQRRQGGRGTVGIGQLTQQCVGQLAAGTAVGGLFLSKAVHQFGSGRAGTALGKEGQFVQPGQKLGSRLPGKLDAEQMADAFRHKGQRGTAQAAPPMRPPAGP